MNVLKLHSEIMKYFKLTRMQAFILIRNAKISGNLKELEKKLKELKEQKQ